MSNPLHGDIHADEFRKAAHEIVDWIADYLEHPAHPVRSAVTPGAIRAALPQAPPQDGEPLNHGEPEQRQCDVIG